MSLLRSRTADPPALDVPPAFADMRALLRHEMRQPIHALHLWQGLLPAAAAARPAIAPAHAAGAPRGTADPGAPTGAADAGALDSVVAAHVAVAVHGLDRLLDLLTVIDAAAGVGGMGPAIEPLEAVDLRALLRLETDAVAPEADERGITLRLPTRRPVRACVRPRALRALVHLMTASALRMTRAEPVVIGIRRLGVQRRIEWHVRIRTGQLPPGLALAQAAAPLAGLQAGRRPCRHGVVLSLQM